MPTIQIIRMDLDDAEPRKIACVRGVLTKKLRAVSL